MEEFRQKLLDNHNGSYVHAWKKTLNPSGSGAASLTELQTAMAKLGFYAHLPEEEQKQMVKMIFEFLDYDFSGTITLEEISVPAYRALARGDDKVFGIDCDAPAPQMTKQSFYERQFGHNGFIRKKGTARYRRAEVEKEAERQKLLDMGAYDLVGFKELLAQKYGNIYRAWKLALDPDGNGRVSKMEFFAAARKVGYHGPVQKLWKECVKDDKDPVVRLRDLSEEIASMTEDFTSLMLKTYGSWLAAWVRAFDVQRTGGCSKDHFISICRKVGYPYSAEKLFGLLDWDLSGLISLEELDEEAQQQLGRGEEKFLRKDGKMGKMSPNERRKTEMVAKSPLAELLARNVKSVTFPDADRPATAPE